MRWQPRALAFVILLAAPSAFGQSPPPRHDPSDVREALQLYEEGNREYEVGHYDEAIAAFKAAFVARPAPEFLFDIAQAYRREGRCSEALEYFHKYEETEPDEARRARAAASMAATHPCEAPPPATVRPATPPEESPAPVAARPTTPMAPDSPSVSAPSRPWWPLALGGVGVVATAAGLLSWVSSRSSYDSLEHSCAPSCDPARFADPQARELAGAILSIGGGVLLAASAVFWLSSGSAPTKPRLAWWIAPGGASIRAGATF